VCLAPLSGWLVQLKEAKACRVYTIHEGKSFIGSGADCEIRILDANLSRQHAYLVLADGMCSIVDMGNSGMPLKVNKNAAVKATLIDGDVIELGATSFKIKLL